MRNPFKPDHPEQHRDNPAVPNAVERPLERAAERASMHDNPLVPNAIERPVERGMGSGRDVASANVDRPGMNDGPGDRPGIKDSPADIARGRAAGGAHRPSTVADLRTDTSRGVTGSRTLADDMRQMEDLFPHEELAGYRTQWESIQTGFVDQPRAAVEQADALVSQIVTRLTEVFARERSTLEAQWTKGDNASTEDLRIALTRYRSFFHRLLSM
jgi:hypothetical protein